MSPRPDRAAFNAALQALSRAAIPLAGEMAAFLPIEAVNNGVILWADGKGLLVSTPSRIVHRGLTSEQWGQVQRLPAFAGYQDARERLRIAGETLASAECTS